MNDEQRDRVEENTNERGMTRHSRRDEEVWKHSEVNVCEAIRKEIMKEY